ncbi:MAG: transposase, partial [Deltaproteobacteria bacterium]|nr:transposase [Deltaproteobacteria bacterium]
MQGKLNSQPKLFSVINLEQFVSEDHPLRDFEKVLDLGFIREFTEKFYCLSNGRPSVDPELFMRIVLLSHIYGISSDRLLCQEVHCNLAYRWFCHLALEDEVPDHSSLTRIRDRLGEETFKTLFEKIIDQ